MNTYLCCTCSFKHLPNTTITVKTEPLGHPFDVTITYKLNGYDYKIVYSYEKNNWDFICSNDYAHIFTKEDIKMFNALKVRFYYMNILKAYDVFVYKSSVFKYGLKDFFKSLFKRKRIRKDYLVALRNLNTIKNSINKLEQTPAETASKQEAILSWLNQKLRWYLLLTYCPTRQHFIRSVLLHSFHKPFKRRRIHYL